MNEFHCMVYSRLAINDAKYNNVRSSRFVPLVDLLFYSVKRCHPGPGKNLLHRKGQRRLIYCSARMTLAFITKWINRSVPRCYDIRRATFEQEMRLPVCSPSSRISRRIGLSIFKGSSLFVEANCDRTKFLFTAQRVTGLYHVIASFIREISGSIRIDKQIESLCFTFFR